MKGIQSSFWFKCLAKIYTAEEGGSEGSRRSRIWAWAIVRPPLRWLQEGQAATRLFQLCSPPWLRGIMWSIVRWNPFFPQYWQVKLSRRKTSRLLNLTLIRGLLIILSSRIIEGRGNCMDTVRIYPRPLRMRDALLVIIKPIARRVLQIFKGSKLAFKTRTGSNIAIP